MKPPSTHPGSFLNLLRTPRLVETPPLPQCEFCIIVPVRNEADGIETTLEALAHQTDLKGKSFDFRRYEVIVFANNCTDNSAAIVTQFARKNPNIVLHIVEKNLSPEESYIGRVRQMLMDEAYRRLMRLGRLRGVIASTDGDTQVDRTWVAATLAEIRNGADAVGGRIVTEKVDRHRLDPYTRACYLRAVGYNFLISQLEAYLDPDPFDPLPRHYQHMGASFAVTAQIYGRSGGLPAVQSSEDIALYQRLMRVGARFRHSLDVRVTTSARQVGRTDMGMANQLQKWADMGQQKQAFLVESAGAIETRLRARRALRTLHDRIKTDRVFRIHEIVSSAQTLGISTDWLIKKLMRSQSFVMLFEEIEQRQQEEGIWQERWQPVPIENAIAELRFQVATLRSMPQTSSKTLPRKLALSSKSARRDRADISRRVEPQETAV
ncbi:MAG: glycosyltransferase family A protein [Geitlerinemataceae cyanobacterium]